jgi:beta-lactamase class A
MRKTNPAVLLTFILVLFVFPLRGQDSLSGRWHSIATAASGRVGVSALVIESGQSASVNGQAHFPMQSVYKLPIAMAVMKKVDEGKLSLAQNVEVHPEEYVPKGKRSPLRDENPHGATKSVRDLIAYALIESDGTASDVLLRLAGGPQAVTDYLRSLGVTEIVVADTEKKMDWKTQYNNWSSPDAAVRLLVNLQSGKALSAGSLALLFGDMQKSRTGRNRIRHLLPAGTIVADKTGTSGTENGVTAATNDIALITLPDGRHLALAVFVSDSRASDEARDDAIAKIARAAWDEWASPK